MSVAFTDLTIGGADRKANAIKAELWRDVNSVGRWLAVLDNAGGTFNGVFDIQDQFLLAVDGNTLMQGRVDSSPGVSLAGIDGADNFKEMIGVRGVDQMQDFLFHNDLDQLYPDTAQLIDDILNDLINVATIATNITYGAVGGTPTVGAIEFREGTSFLGTLQEMFRSVDWLYYVDDVLALQSGAPGFSAMGVGSDVVCQLGNANNNVLGQVEFTERDGGKLYNRIRLYGKNPQFDAYNEFNAASWTSVPAAQILDDTTTVRVGGYSQVVYNDNPVASNLHHILTAPVFNHTTWDFTKGIIGFWGYWDNVNAAPGVPAPGAGGKASPAMCEIKLTDNAASFVRFFGDKLGGIGATKLWEDEWGWCQANLGGESDPNVALVANKWTRGGAGVVFDWGNVVEIDIAMGRFGTGPPYVSHFYIDGLTIPVPPIALSENGVSQAAYRIRPLVLNMPNIRTQNTLDAKSDSLLSQHKDSGINFVKFTIIGNHLFRYAGQSFDIFIPDLGIDDGAGGPLVYYATSIHHVIEPKVDVSGGFGYDWITEVEAVPTGTTAFDHARLGPRAVFSGYQVGMSAGTGVRVK